MSKTTESAKIKTKSNAKPRAEVGPAMFGRDLFVEALECDGVEVIFAYPGGASMEIHQALTKSKILTILPRHEQGGSFAAEGYARVTGKAGVCMGTSYIPFAIFARIFSAPSICRLLFYSRWQKTLNNS